MENHDATNGPQGGSRQTGAIGPKEPQIEGRISVVFKCFGGDTVFPLYALFGTIPEGHGVYHQRDVAVYHTQAFIPDRPAVG